MNNLYDKISNRNIILCTYSKSKPMKQLSCLTYGRAPAKGSNSALTRNRRIDITLHQREWMHKI